MSQYSIAPGRCINKDGEPFVLINKCHGASPVEADEFARLCAKAPDFKARLQQIEDLLTTHPDAQKGNSKVHLALMLAQGAKTL